MASRKKQLLHELTKPVDLEDAFPLVSEPEVIETIPQPTGLSEIADVNRQLAIHMLGEYCPQCEEYYEQGVVWCPKCLDKLQPVGTKPKKRKYW